MKYKVTAKIESEAVYPVKETVYRLELAHISEGQQGHEYVSAHPARLAVPEETFNKAKIGDMYTLEATHA